MSKKKKKRQAAAPEKKAPPPRAPAFLRRLCPPAAAEEPAWRWLWPWLGVAFVLRAALGVFGDFLLHPDEIMQYLEPAHKAVFGYGVSYWEHYYGARSFLIPGFVAAVLWLAKATGLDHPGFYVYAVKVAFCAVAVLIPWACYRIGRRFFGEEAGRLALILTCLWPYLIVFAHKPFTEFVATAVFFAAFGLACRPAAEKRGGAFAVGLLLALAAAVRMQYLPIAGLLWLGLALGRGRGWALASIAGGASMVLAVGVFEALTWDYPYQSYYVNFMANLLIAQNRHPEPAEFYVIRLMVATGMLFPAALYMMGAQLRKCALLALLLVFTLLLHNLQVHKELRFIFVIQPLFLLLIAPGLLRWLGGVARPGLRLGLPGAYAAAFALIVCFNFYDDRWLHAASSRERGDTFYLREKNNLYGLYLRLHDAEDLQGLAHFGDPYFNTPGYYYLHRDVPFYDESALEAALRQTGGRRLRPLVTHVVSKRSLGSFEDFELQRPDGEYLLYVSAAPGAVRGLEDHSPYIVGGSMHYEFRRRGITSLPQPPSFPKLLPAAAER